MTYIQADAPVGKASCTRSWARCPLLGLPPPPCPQLDVWLSTLSVTCIKMSWITSHR